ncbi:M15 family metallopeptidase [Demequina sp. NBRC 110053]|uniref:M15 family metallopeptidase n=1 Tax=Demequina sp. NBRC 110053 TaxID=1570342 RepID=UPI000A011911|nr:M15 family metallopeptidase [Demequina sp. NBRC 110053]
MSGAHEHDDGGPTGARRRRLALVATAVVALFTFGGALGVAGALWLGSPAERSAPGPPAPTVTVTAGAVAGEAGDGAATGAPTDAAADAPATTAANTTAPITAPSLDSSSAAAPEPRVSVSPSVDLDAHSLDDPASIWVVVNKRRPIDPLGWAPPELDPVPGGGRMTPEAATAMIAMRDAAADAGAGFSIGTAYRSHGVQQGLYSRYVGTWGTERADTFSARPGYSEHQTGLAADIYQSSACRLKPCFGDEPAGRWVAEHAHEFGFHLTYPEGSTDVTGYRYEPWHVRYVGVELATYLHDQSIATLEEAFGLPAAPDYD